MDVTRENQASWALEQAWRSSESRPITERLAEFLLGTSCTEVAVDSAIKQDVTLLVIENPRRLLNKRPPCKVSSQTTSGGDAAFCVDQPFDDSRFNFFRVDASEEVSMCSKSSQGKEWCFRILFNIAPVSSEHFLLVSKCRVGQSFGELQQPMCFEFLEDILSWFVNEGLGESGNFLLFFSTFGALASVNHLHWQILRRPAMSANQRLMLESLPLEEFKSYTWGELKRSSVTAKPSDTNKLRHDECLHYVVFQLEDAALVNEYASAVGEFLATLTARNVAHNVCSLHHTENTAALLSLAVVPRRGNDISANFTRYVPGVLEILGIFVVQDALVGDDQIGVRDWETLVEHLTLDKARFQLLLDDFSGRLAD